MPCVDRNKLVYNIKELPEVFNVEPVDLFIVETLDGTGIVSFDNIIFDLTQTTFETAFNKHTTDITTLSADVDQIISNSGSGYDHSLLESTSGNWDSSYSTVQTYSAAWSQGSGSSTTPDSAIPIGIGQSYISVGNSGLGTADPNPVTNTSDRSWFVFVSLVDNEDIWVRNSANDAWLAFWPNTGDRGPGSIILQPGAAITTDKAGNFFILK
jgi:hypothetical protein